MSQPFWRNLIQVAVNCKRGYAKAAETDYSDKYAGDDGVQVPEDVYHRWASWRFGASWRQIIGLASICL